MVQFMFVGGNSSPRRSKSSSSLPERQESQQKGRGPSGQVFGSVSPAGSPVVVTITWSRHVGDDWQTFKKTHRREFGIYLFGDATYSGSKEFRTITQEQVYLGSNGGNFPQESGTTSGEVRGSLGMRYYGRTYSNAFDALAGINTFDLSKLNPSLGKIERPLYYGSIAQSDRMYILTIEAYYIHLYRQGASSSGYTLVNTLKKPSIPSLPSWLTISHVGSKPSLV